jgi:hypothetical protein
MSHMNPRGGCEPQEPTSKQLQEYGRLMREQRALEGLTDGLRLGRVDFADYLARRRKEDQDKRGW